MRKWLDYDDAVFFTFFGLVGLLFLNPHMVLIRMIKLLMIGYHVLLVGTIILVGARVSVLTYLVFLVNMVLKFRPRFVHG